MAMLHYGPFSSSKRCPSLTQMRAIAKTKNALAIAKENAIEDCGDRKGLKLTLKYRWVSTGGLSRADLIHMVENNLFNHEWNLGYTVIAECSEEVAQTFLPKLLHVLGDDVKVTRARKPRKK